MSCRPGPGAHGPTRGSIFQGADDLASKARPKVFEDDDRCKTGASETEDCPSLDGLGCLGSRRSADLREGKLFKQWPAGRVVGTATRSRGTSKNPSGVLGGMVPRV